MAARAAGATEAAAHGAVPADEARAAGLAHVAAVSFLGARAAPSGGFWISLAGGVALARAGERLGMRRGYGASIAAMLQSVAMMGPSRFSVPVTQAMSAPLLGRMDARGRSTLAQVLACAAIRTVQNATGTAFFIGIVTGLDAYAASYGEVVERLGSLPLVGPVLSLPTGVRAALVATAAGLLAWSAFGSTMQVLVYRRGLARWRAGAASGEDSDPTGTAEAGERVEVRPGGPDGGSGERAHRPPRLDPRAITAAAVIAFSLLLLSTSWMLLAAVAAWLVAASLAAGRLERDVIPAGLALAAVLALSGFAFSMVGGLGLDVALRRAARAGLLVLVATWLRAAAGSDGLREVARRGLRRLRAIPSLEEAGRALDEIGAAPRLAAAARALFGSLKPARKRPLPMVDAVLAWVRSEATRFRPAPPAAVAAARLRARDAALVMLAVLPAAALA
jgi:hypothetical protein